jgi:Tol biopolymer transport system component
MQSEGRIPAGCDRLPSFAAPAGYNPRTSKAIPMDDQPSGAPPSVDSPLEGRLDSWKEIAGYLKRDVTTVQRWEKREGMPVHRHLHARQGSVYAFRAELDAWARGRAAGLPPEAESDSTPRATPVEAPAPASVPAHEWPAGRRSRGTRAIGWLAVLAAVLAGAAFYGSRRVEVRNPIAGAQFRSVTDFDGIEQAAAVSRDGRFVAFLSDRDGQMDVWVTQVGTGQFYNLTRGAVREIVNPSVRTLGFSPDGALVTFWLRRTGASGNAEIGTWAVPTLGGPPRPYLDGVAEFDWSADGARLVYHTPAVGDPTYIREPARGTDRLILTAAEGLHAHFPIWSPDDAFVYFVQGSPTGAMDIWRVKPEGGSPERVTQHASRVSHPVMTDARTLLYLATDHEGGGPWLYSVDVDERISRRVSSGVDRYTSLAAAADGRRLVLTVANPKGTLWRLPLHAKAEEAPSPIPLTTASGFAPRLGPGFLLYVSSRGASDSIWTLAEGKTAQLWTAPEARVIGNPAIDGAGRRVAFTAGIAGRTVLYVMNADGTDARAVTATLALRGAPAWAPDGSITSAVDVGGSPHLFRIALDGGATPLVRDYAVDPVWSPDGAFVVYSGADVGTTFPVKAVTAAGVPYPLSELMLTRGARRVRFAEEVLALVVLRGDIQHKDLWRVDLATGQQQQLTRLPADFNIRDFDISPDGREVVLERVQDHSDVVMLETPAR